MSSSRMLTNMFELQNLDQLNATYRLLEITNLPRGDNYDKNINRLASTISYQLREPVAVVRNATGNHLAIPGDSAIPNLTHTLMPHVVELVPKDEIHPLDFINLDRELEAMAVNWLQYAFRGALFRNKLLWGGPRSYFHRKPNRVGGCDVDAYPGFSWAIVRCEGNFFLSVDVTAKYVDRLWLAERIERDGGSSNRYLHKHCLYHFGHAWYTIQLWGILERSIRDQLFTPGGSDPIDIYRYTLDKAGKHPPRFISELDPESPAIVYRNPGNGEQRYGALALCKLTVKTDDRRTARLHRTSILQPGPRLEAITKAVEDHLSEASLLDVPIDVSAIPRAIERRVFPVPAQRFGSDRVVAVDDVPQYSTDVVDLVELGRRRLSLVKDPSVKPVIDMPFDSQFLLVPRSAPRRMIEDFKTRLGQAMHQVSGRSYEPTIVIYDDRKATSLHRQVSRITDALRGAGASRGYGVLVLPEHPHRDLHNCIKRDLWPNIQVQCASVAKIAAHYVDQGREGKVRKDRLSRLGSYVLNCALGVIMVNRRWLWSLDKPLHYDIYIGVDVLNGMAGVTFVYDRGRSVFFRNYPCKQRERLTRKQFREILVRHLPEDLDRLKLRPNSLVIHRDGRTYQSELNGLSGAIDELMELGVLPQDLLVGVVDIRKDTAENLRLFTEEGRGPQNPTVGSYATLSEVHGIVSTTGQPYRFDGTARPLSARIVQGRLNIDSVLEDVFALSQLAYSAPDKCSRLPLTIKLADDLLEPIAGDVDEEESRYDDREVARFTTQGASNQRQLAAGGD